MKDRIGIGVLCLGVLLLGALLWQTLPPAAARGAAPGLPNSAGRYSISATSDCLYFADTQTGRVWYRDISLILTEKGGFVKPAWHEMPSPVSVLSGR